MRALLDERSNDGGISAGGRHGINTTPLERDGLAKTTPFHRAANLDGLLTPRKSPETCFVKKHKYTII